MKALARPAPSKCEATVNGNCETVLVTKTTANNSNAMNTSQVAEAFMTPATAQGKANDSWVLPPAVHRSNPEIPAMCANDAARA